MKLTDNHYAALHRQLHVFTNSVERWAELKRLGATNQEIVAYLDELWGYGCGQSGPGEIPTSAHGRPPRLWFANDWGKGKPDLKGLELVKAVRQVMGVGGRWAVRGRDPEEQLILEV